MCNRCNSNHNCNCRNSYANLTYKGKTLDCIEVPCGLSYDAAFVAVDKKVCEVIESLGDNGGELLPNYTLNLNQDVISLLKNGVSVSTIPLEKYLDNIFLESSNIDPNTNILTLTNSNGSTVTQDFSSILGNGGGSGENNVQSDWNETDTQSDAFILNKPTIPTVDPETVTTLVDNGNSFTYTNEDGDSVTVNLPTGGEGGSDTPEQIVTKLEGLTGTDRLDISAVEGVIENTDRTLEFFGAVGDGTTDDSTAIQTAVDSANKLKLAKDKTYLISSTIIIPDGLVIDLNGSTITSSTTDELFDLRGNTIIENGRFVSTLVRASESFFGLIQSINKPSEKVIIRNCYFSVPNANINAIKFDNSAGGVASENIILENLDFEDIGRMAVECISHTNQVDNDLNYIGNVHLINARSKNTGTQGDFGMLYSGSGNVINSYVENVIADDFMDIALEDSGTKNYIVNNAILINPKNTTDRFIGAFVNTNHSLQQDQHINTVFSNIQIEGDGIVQIASVFNPVKVNDIVIKGAVKIEGRNVIWNNPTIDTTLIFQSITDNQNIIKGGKISFGDGLSFFDARDSNIHIIDVELSKTDGGQVGISTNGGSYFITGGSMDNGYFNMSDPVVNYVTNYRITNPGVGTGLFGTATYNRDNVYVDGVKQETPLGDTTINGSFTQVTGTNEVIIQNRRIRGANNGATDNLNWDSATVHTRDIIMNGGRLTAASSLSTPLIITHSNNSGTIELGRDTAAPGLDISAGTFTGNGENLTGISTSLDNELGYTSWKFQEIKNRQTGLTGTTLTLPSTPVTDFEEDVFKNGLLLEDTEDYTISGDTITFTTALTASDRIVTRYKTNS